MQDYVYPSIFFSYFLFLIFLVGGIYFFIRSWHHGYFGPDGEETKYRMLHDEEVDRGRN